MTIHGEIVTNFPLELTKRNKICCVEGKQFDDPFAKDGLCKDIPLNCVSVNNEGICNKCEEGFWNQVKSKEDF